MGQKDCAARLFLQKNKVIQATQVVTTSFYTIADHANISPFVSV
jgi:hypothetical protein